MYTNKEHCFCTCNCLPLWISCNHQQLCKRNGGLNSPGALNRSFKWPTSVQFDGFIRVISLLNKCICFQRSISGKIIECHQTLSKMWEPNNILIKETEHNLGVIFILTSPGTLNPEKKQKPLLRYWYFIGPYGNIKQTLLLTSMIGQCRDE